MAEVVGDEAYVFIRPHLEQALTGALDEFEAWLPYEGAGTRYAHVEYVPDQREDGEVACVYVLVSDITERRRTEEAIERLHAENQAQLGEMQALFDAAPIGIFFGRDTDFARW